MASTKSYIRSTSSIPVGYVDESGTGNGPFDPVVVLCDATGAPITAANPLPTTGGVGASALAPGENHIGEVGGNIAIAKTSFTRPANTTAYASGQLVGNDLVAANIVPVALAAARKAGGNGSILRARLTKSGTSIVNASFRIHLYKVAPTSSVGDGGAYLTNQALEHIGNFDITMDRVFTDGAKGFGIPLVGSSVFFDTALGSVNIYALVEARAAYTPIASEAFTVALEVSRN